MQSAGGAYHGDAYMLGQTVATCGGAPLRTLHLDAAMFAPEAMSTGGGLPFEEMIEAAAAQGGARGARLVALGAEGDAAAAAARAAVRGGDGRASGRGRGEWGRHGR